MRASRVALGGVVAIFSTLTAFACSLDLDEKLLTPPSEAGVKIGDANLPDGTIITESGVPIIPNVAACSKDEECVAANACLKGRCDLTRRACAYDICHAQACNVGTCDPGPKTCGAATTYKLKAGELALPEVTSGGIVAAYPWIFQLTQHGVMAYDVSNPTKSTGVAGGVQVVGIGFIPTSFTRSGNRIWFTAPLQGAAAPLPPTPTRLSLAYIDVPTDPFVTRIEGHTVLATYNRPASNGAFLVPTNDKGALVLSQDVSGAPDPVTTWFATPLEVDLAEPASKTATSLALATGQRPVATSGTRLVLDSTAPLTGFTNQFALVTDPGTPNQQTRALTPVNDTTTMGQQRGFAASTGGAVVWFTNTVQPSNPPTDPPTTVTHSVKAYFLVKDGNASIEAGAKSAEVEVYPDATAPAITTQTIGTSTMLDENTALVTVLASDSAGSTAVDFVKSDGTVLKDKRLILTAPFGTVFSATASDGFAYLAVNTTVPPPDGMGAATTTSKVVIIDPACNP